MLKGLDLESAPMDHTVCETPEGYPFTIEFAFFKQGRVDLHTPILKFRRKTGKAF